MGLTNPLHFEATPSTEDAGSLPFHYNGTAGTAAFFVFDSRVGRTADAIVTDAQLADFRAWWDDVTNGQTVLSLRTRASRVCVRVRACACVCVCVWCGVAWLVCW